MSNNYDNTENFCKDNIEINLQEYTTIWGNILGDIKDQTDLWRSLSGINVEALTHYLSTNNIIIDSSTINKDLSVGGTIYTGTTAIVLGTYNTTIGDGVVSAFDVEHNLGTKDISVVVRDFNTNVFSYPSIESLDNNNARLTFNFIPSLSSYYVSIFAGVPSTRVAAYSPDITLKPRAYTLYVSMSGNDNFSGRHPDRAVRTIKKACEIAHNDRVLSKNDPLVKYTIHVATGDFAEENPVYVPPSVSIIGDNLRRCTVRPKNPLCDIFWVDNSSYVWGFTFRGHLDPSAATAFPNFANPVLSGIATKNLLTPFVRSTLIYDKEKCKRDLGYILDGIQQDIDEGSNLHSILNGQAYYNGVTSVLPTGQVIPTVEAIQYAQTLTKDYLSDSPEIGVIDETNSLSSIDLLFSTVVDIISGGSTNYAVKTFARPETADTAIAIIEESEETIKTQVIDYLDALYPDIYKWRKPFITTSPYIQGSSSITTGFPAILQSPQTVFQTYNPITPASAPLSIPIFNDLLDTVISIVSNNINSYNESSFTPPADISIASALLQEYIGYIQDKTIEYVKKYYPELTYDESKCRRDVEYILTALQTDAANGNNEQSILNGQAYYTGVTSVLPDDQKLPTVYAFENLKSLISYVVTGSYSDRRDIEDAFNTITDIMTFGPNIAIPYTNNVFPGALSAAQLLHENTSFIQKEVIAFVNKTYPNLDYDKTKCERDIGYILSAVRLDIENGDNEQSIINGQAYYNGNSLYIPENQVLPTIAAISYAKELAVAIGSNQTTQEKECGCGMRVDGKLAEGFLRSMVLDSYTQFNQNGKGIHILNNGYAQLVSIFTICCTEGVKCETGGSCSISNSNCSFGLSGITSTGKSSTPILTGTLVKDPFAGNTFIVKDVEGVIINPNSDYYSPTAPIDTRKIAYTPYNGLIFTVGNDQELFVIEKTPAPTLSAGTTDTFIVNVTLNTFKHFNPGDKIKFYLRSVASASSHTFEYVGTGVYLDRSVPALGGITQKETEVVFDNEGIVYFTSTNEGGDFNVGEDFTIVQETGTIEGDTFKRSILTLVTPLNLALE